VTELTRLEESDAYRSAREELRLAEVEFMRHRERVAEMRRALPDDTVVGDYEFEEGEPARRVKLSELFTSGDRSLVIYHFMFGKQQRSACPMCTMWIDGFNAVAKHLRQRVDFAVVAAPPLDALHNYARSRAWDDLRLIVDAGTFKYDLASEDADGNQDSTISVFRMVGGTIRHTYTGHPWFSPDQEERGIDELTPVWNLLDLTPDGRGEDWYPSTSY
jgi:predicted dithiol-disulfide oxidoreductase (DUF899 family)